MHLPGTFIDPLIYYNIDKCKLIGLFTFDQI